MNLAKRKFMMVHYLCWHFYGYNDILFLNFFFLLFNSIFILDSINWRPWRKLITCTFSINIKTFTHAFTNSALIYFLYHILWNKSFLFTSRINSRWSSNFKIFKFFILRFGLLNFINFAINLFLFGFKFSLLNDSSLLIQLHYS